MWEYLTTLILKIFFVVAFKRRVCEEILQVDVIKNKCKLLDTCVP
jgi:hypothetical protein